MKVLSMLFMLIVELCGLRSQTASDIIHMNYTFIPSVGLAQNKGMADVRQFDIFGKMPPIRIGQRINFVNAFYYRTTELNYDETYQNQNIFPARLYDIRYMPVFRIQMNPLWTFLLLPRIVMRGDLERPLSRKYFIPETGFIISYTYNGNYKLKMGIGGGMSFFENGHKRFWPLILFNYQKRKVKYEISLPYANLSYNVAKDFEVGIFSMVENYFSGVTPFSFENETATHLRITQMIVAPTVSHRLFRNFFGHIKLGGIYPLRKIQPLDEDFNRIDVLKFGAFSSLFFKIGISYRRME